MARSSDGAVDYQDAVTEEGCAGNPGFPGKRSTGRHKSKRCVRAAESEQTAPKFLGHDGGLQLRPRRTPNKADTS